MAAVNRQHFRRGDEVKVLGTWYPVLRVNAKSVTVTPLVLMGQPATSAWTDTARYDEVYGGRRDGTILHTPPPSPDATCTEQVAIPTFNAESDAGPCTRAPVVRLTVRHDGTACGCSATCMIPDPDEPGGAVPEPWTEVLLLCAEHRDEYPSIVGAGIPGAAVTVEEPT